MKQCDLTKGFVVFLTIIITLFCGVMPSSWAGDSANCDYCKNQKFEGCYGFSHDGMMITPDTGPLPVPMASVGVFYLDGKGNLTGHEMVNFGGESFPATINGNIIEMLSDCTGTVTICATPENGDTGGIESEISFVITGDEIQMLTTKMTHCVNNENSGVPAAIALNIVGTAKKQNCDDQQ